MFQPNRLPNWVFLGQAVSEQRCPQTDKQTDRQTDRHTLSLNIEIKNISFLYEINNCSTSAVPKKDFCARWIHYFLYSRKLYKYFIFFFFFFFFTKIKN
jgi:hypothetical protein